jgi:integrase
VWKEIEEFLQFEPRNLRDIRDRALVAVAYDTMCRREELVNLRIEDIEDAGDGSGSVLTRRSKTDSAGEGATAYLSRLAMRLVGGWLKASQSKSGPVFARVVGGNGLGNVAGAQIVTAVLRRGRPMDWVAKARVGEDFGAFVPSWRGSGSIGVEH